MSSALPSIKGSIFGLAIEDLRKLVAEGHITREELERKLAPGDAAYLDETIRTSGWYDVRAYGRLLEILKEVAGDGRDEYLLERGRRSAEALIGQRVYQQMDYLDRTQVASAKSPEERSRAFGRDLKLLISVNSALFNFGRTTVRDDPQHPDRYILEYLDVEAMPEAMTFTSLGFMNRMAEQHGHPDLWVRERPCPDIVRFHMKRSL